MKTWKIVVALLLLQAAAVVGFVYSGIYPIGADVPHDRVTGWLLETLRERSVHRASAGITVPALDDPALVQADAGEYAAMCAGCHLQPGVDDSMMRQGLYPQPPNLARADDDAASATPGQQRAESALRFWVVKHGIKASGMPAWGLTHDDRTIWALVAFVDRLPTMSASDYARLTAAGHGHGHGAAAPAAASSSPASDNPGSAAAAGSAAPASGHHHAPGAAAHAHPQR